MYRDPDTAALKNGMTAYEEGLPYRGRPSFLSDGAEKVIPKPWNKGENASLCGQNGGKLTGRLIHWLKW